MEKILIAIFMSFIGACSINSNGPNDGYKSFLVKDNVSGTCYYIYSSPMYLGRKATWSAIMDENYRETSNNFDIAVVHNEQYEEAAKLLKVDFGKCINGLK